MYISSILMTSHRQHQIEVIDRMETAAKSGHSPFSVVSSVNDFDNDNRLCITSVHLPNEMLKNAIAAMIQPLKLIEPEYYYYRPDSLHLTVKNIRVVNDPPHFTAKDTLNAEKIFAQTIPAHYCFNVYFYRLLVFPGNLSLAGTTDPELDNIITDLDRKLNSAGLSDDKKYLNNRYFICNVTIARFNRSPSRKFINAVSAISSAISIPVYTVDTVTLLSSTAVLGRKKIFGTWKLIKRQRTTS